MDSSARVEAVDQPQRISLSDKRAPHANQQTDARAHIRNTMARNQFKSTHRMTPTHLHQRLQHQLQQHHHQHQQHRQHQQQYQQHQHQQHQQDHRQQPEQRQQKQSNRQKLMEKVHRRLGGLKLQRQQRREYVQMLLQHQNKEDQQAHTVAEEAAVSQSNVPTPTAVPLPPAAPLPTSEDSKFPSNPIGSIRRNPVHLETKKIYNLLEPKNRSALDKFTSKERLAQVQSGHVVDEVDILKRRRELAVQLLESQRKREAQKDEEQREALRRKQQLQKEQQEEQHKHENPSPPLQPASRQGSEPQNLVSPLGEASSTHITNVVSDSIPAVDSSVSLLAPTPTDSAAEGIYETATSVAGVAPPSLNEKNCDEDKSASSGWVEVEFEDANENDHHIIDSSVAVDTMEEVQAIEEKNDASHEESSSLLSASKPDSHPPKINESNDVIEATTPMVIDDVVQVDSELEELELRALLLRSLIAKKVCSIWVHAIHCASSIKSFSDCVNLYLAIFHLLLS